MKVQIWMSVFLAVGISACGKNAPAPAPGRGVEKEPLKGSITENIGNIQKGRYRDSCETKYEKLQQVVAAALDSRAQEIEAFAPKLYESANWKVVPMGKSFAREPKTKRPVKTGWQTDSYENWAVIGDEYQKVKGEPMNQDWVWLNADVKSILSDDRYRVINHGNYLLTKDDGPMLLQISKNVEKCLSDSSCGAPSLSDLEAKFVQNNVFYAEKLKAVDSGQALLSKREALSELDGQILEDLPLYSFYSNRSVHRGAPGEVLLPLDGTAFSDAQGQIAGYIESLWKKANLALKVEWVQASQATGAFSLILEQGAGGRSFVRPSERGVHLFPYVRSRSIAHEIGHVLGFPDHYYTTWSPEQCGYIVQSAESDLMSDPETGSVTDEEWKELEDAYPAA